jgi:hypothetical protein
MAFARDPSTDFVDAPNAQASVDRTETARRTVAVQISTVLLRNPTELEHAFSSLPRAAWIPPLVIWHGDGRFTRLEGEPCGDCAAALAASWRLRPTPRDPEGPA